MPLTNRDLATKVIARVEHLGQEASGFYIPDVIALIPEALKKLGISVHNSNDQTQIVLLQKIFTPAIAGTLGNQTVDLSTQTSLSEPIIVDPPFATVTHSSFTFRAEWVADSEMLNYTEADQGLLLYTVEGNTLYLKYGVEITSALAGNLSITASYIPLIASVPPQLQDTLVDILIGMLIPANVKPRK